MLLGITLAITSSINAQGWAVQKNRQPGWISDKGFWQIEGNVNSPRTNTVYFFNNDRVLIYKEEVRGVKLDLSKLRVKMRLKRALETAILVWEQKQELTTGGHLVSNVFSNSKR